MERDVLSILGDLDDGELVLRLTDELRRCVNGARSADKAAKLTLTLSIEPDGRMFIITSKVKADIPTPATAMTAFYATNDGELLRDDPKQVPLRNVPQKPTELRTVAPSAPKEA